MLCLVSRRATVARVPCCEPYAVAVRLVRLCPSGRRTPCCHALLDAPLPCCPRVGLRRLHVSHNRLDSIPAGLACTALTRPAVSHNLGLCFTWDEAESLLDRLPHLLEVEDYTTATHQHVRFMVAEAASLRRGS